MTDRTQQEKINNTCSKKLANKLIKHAERADFYNLNAALLSMDNDTAQMLEANCLDRLIIEIISNSKADTYSAILSIHYFFRSGLGEKLSDGGFKNALIMAAKETPTINVGIMMAITSHEKVSCINARDAGTILYHIIERNDAYTQYASEQLLNKVDEVNNLSLELCLNTLRNSGNYGLIGMLKDRISQDYVPHKSADNDDHNPFNPVLNRIMNLSRSLEIRHQQVQSH